MKRFSEQFKKQAETISMRASERNELRARLVSYMEYHPLPKEIASHKKNAAISKGAIVSEPFFALKFNAFHIRSFAGVFAVFLVIGVPFIAERSMPGDVLYPVKVEFNEELRSSLALSPYAKVAWETQRLERRLTEARLLASEGKLTQEAEIKVAAAVKVHSDAAKREIAQIRESDSDEAAIAEIAFASALAVQSEMLEGHIEKGEQTDKGKKDNSVLALVNVVAEERNSAEAAQFGAIPSYAKLLGRVESESTQIYELFSSIKEQATDKEVGDVERRLADIERKIAEAVAIKEGRATQDDLAMATMSQTSRSMKDSVGATVTTLDATSTASSSEAALSTTTVPESDEQKREDRPKISEADAEVQAVRVLRSALTDIQKLLSYMTHIEVRENVSIEDLLPITLTPEERVQEVMDLLEMTMKLQARIDSYTPTSEVAQKFSLGKGSLKEQVSKAVKVMEDGDIGAAHVILTEALLLGTDLENMTGIASSTDALDSSNAGPASEDI